MAPLSTKLLETRDSHLAGKLPIEEWKFKCCVGRNYASSEQISMAAEGYISTKTKDPYSPGAVTMIPLCTPLVICLRSTVRLGDYHDQQ